MNRRGAIAGAGIALSTALGGCLQAGLTDPDGRSPDPTSPDGSCETATARRPAPDAQEAKQYPDYPDALTAATARSFASAYERAYRYNEKTLALGDGYALDVSVNVPGWAVREVERGFDVGVDCRVQWDFTGETETGEGTAMPSGFTVSHVWYRLTDRVGLRSTPGDWELERGDTPDFGGADTVACDGAGG